MRDLYIAFVHSTDVQDRFLVQIYLMFEELGSNLYMNITAPGSIQYIRQYKILIV